MLILEHDYKLLEVPLDELKHRGWWDGEKQKIFVGKELPVDAQEATILHEVIHALDFMLGVGLSEKQVKRLEHGLFQVLSRNGVSLAPLRKELEDIEDG